MPKIRPALSPNEPDPALLAKLATLKRICLVVATAFSFIAFVGWLVPPLGRIFPGDWPLMQPESALTVALCAFSLHLSEAGHPRQRQRLSMLLAVLTTLLAAAILFGYWFNLSLGFDAAVHSANGAQALIPGRMSPLSAGGFTLLGIAAMLVRAQKRSAIRLADLAVSCLGLLVLILVSGYIFNATQMFGLSGDVRNSPQTLFCISLLTLVAFLRRSEIGVFSIFLGRSIGSRIARILSPILLAIPFLREAARAHFINAGRMPPHYATAILASSAAMVSLALLLFLSWRIKSMEIEIHALSLRDDLTGLHNRKGFYLLADQALRLAHRSTLPFSVLYIDLDNLKQINDSLGHDAGSEFLVETAKMLKNTFRETDVIGRIGGDEFAVAGQFDKPAIAIATKRLQESCDQRNALAGRQIALSFSIGHATSESARRDTLDELVSEADHVMYREKRHKKMQIN